MSRHVLGKDLPVMPGLGDVSEIILGGSGFVTLELVDY